MTSVLSLQYYKQHQFFPIPPNWNCPWIWPSMTVSCQGHIRRMCVPNVYMFLRICSHDLFKFYSQHFLIYSHGWYHSWYVLLRSQRLFATWLCKAKGLKYTLHFNISDWFIVLKYWDYITHLIDKLVWDDKFNCRFSFYSIKTVSGGSHAGLMWKN